MIKYYQPTSGDYAITEQGDLGLGLTPIEEGVDIKPEKTNKDEDHDKK